MTRNRTSPSITAVLFDFDGTITTPGHLDFAAIRHAVGCPDGLSILTYIESLPPGGRERAEKILDDFEMEAAAQVNAAPGLEELLTFLDFANMQRGILTRNTLRAVERSTMNIPFVSLESFACIISRDDDLPVKPEPDGVLEAARVFGTPPEQILSVGDYIYDIEAGNRAGAVTAYIDNLPSRAYAAPKADYTISDLRTLIAILSSLTD